MKTYINPNDLEIKEICTRPTEDLSQIKSVVESIFNEVQTNGDAAVSKYTHYFDKVDVTNSRISRTEIDAALTVTSIELKTALLKAKANIEKFHSSQVSADVELETSKGVYCQQISRPIETIGIYIPGGTAPLLSTVLMLAVPAQIAGVERIVMCTPPSKSGTVDPAILFAADLCGVTEIYKVGGVQAIAAMTFGTATIPKVMKVFGPGNQYVTAAKTLAQQYGLAIDMPAGPSELLVLADETCVPEFVAADLLSQAEHGKDSQVICITCSNEITESIQKAILDQVELLPRKEIAKLALNHARFIVIDDESNQLELINTYAPEHLILAIKNPRDFISGIKNAGSVFLGNYTPESAGDYASGTNHTLPTSGYSKSYSGVNMDAFVKKITVQEINKNGLLDLGSTIEVLAEAEQLIGHKNAVTIRLKSLENES